MPVHVIDARLASDVDGQVIAGTGPAGAVNVSLTTMPESVTVPVFLTTKEYVTTWPIVVIVVGDAVLVTVMPLVCDVVMVAVEGADVIAAPVGGVPLAVAELPMLPLSKSAWVAV